MRRKEWGLRWLVMLVMLGLVPLCSKADSNIRVHMIDAQSGLPIANSPVRLWTHGAAEIRNDAGFVQGQTDSKVWPHFI